MWGKIKLFFVNWKTAVPGALAGICAADEFFGYMPETWQVKSRAVCVFLIAMGLIAAKDADKSNAVNPSETKSVN